MRETAHDIAVSSGSAHRWAPAGRVLAFPLWAAIALLGAEYLVFSVTFDSAELRSRSDAWAIAGYSGSLAVFVATAALGVVLVTKTTALHPRWLVAKRPIDALTLGVLAAHAACVAVLWWLTARMLSPLGPPAGEPPVWLAAWLLTATATPLFASLAVFPAARIERVLARNWPALVGGGVIGAGAWVAGQGSVWLWEPLGPWTLHAVDRCLAVLFDHTYYDPARSLIGSDRFQVLIHQACSGFEGVGLMTVFVVSYLLIGRRELRFPHALLLLPLGIAATLAANVARIVTLVVVGTSISPAIAAGGFHARAGWLFFSAMALTLVLLSRRLRFFASAPSVCDLTHPTAAYLLPLVTLLGVGLMTGLATASVDLLYGVRIFTAAAVLFAFRHHYRDVGSRFSWTSVFAGVAAALVFIALAPRPAAEAMGAWLHEWEALPAWMQLPWILTRVLGSILVVPAAEELAFRGYLLRRLVSRDFEAVSPRQAPMWALIVSSVAFGGIHAGWLGGTIAGLLFGLVQIRANSVGQAIVAHAVSNAVVAAYVLGLGQWWLWI